MSTIAGRDVDNGSQCALFTSINHGFDTEVIEIKPLAIVSCWPEAAKQEADLSLSQGETASTR
jgi:hypothetical protein